jgi:hypothetical protein
MGKTRDAEDTRTIYIHKTDAYSSPFTFQLHALFTFTFQLHALFTCAQILIEHYRAHAHK